MVWRAALYNINATLREHFSPTYSKATPLSSILLLSMTTMKKNSITDFSTFHYSSILSSMLRLTVLQMPNVGRPLKQVDSSWFPFIMSIPQCGIYHGMHTLTSQIGQASMTSNL